MEQIGLSWVRDWMYNAVAGACAEQGLGGAPAPLALTVTDPAPLLIDTNISQTSNPGEIASTATASGGTAPYTYAWKLKEISDPDGAFSPASQGTTTNSTYDTATITTTYSGVPLPPPNPPPPPPPIGAQYQVECQVTDSAVPAAVVTVSSNSFGVDAF